MGRVDKSLFTLNHGTDVLLVQIYVYDITFWWLFSHSCIQISGNDEE
jgi:hypothetical protein